MIWRSFILVSFAAVATLLTGCLGPRLKDYQGTVPAFDFREYFTGPVKAWGIIQSRNGKVTRRFEVDLVGSWQANQGRLEEHFQFYDGETWRRTWYLTQVSPTEYRAEADDVPGHALGRIEGSAMQWSYQLEIDLENHRVTVTLDDWMFTMRDGILFNHSTMKKFGFKVGELTLFMQKR